MEEKRSFKEDFNFSFTSGTVTVADW